MAVLSFMKERIFELSVMKAVSDWHCSSTRIWELPFRPLGGTQGQNQPWDVKGVWKGIPEAGGNYVRPAIWSFPTKERMTSWSGKTWDCFSFVLLFQSSPHPRCLVSPRKLNRELAAESVLGNSVCSLLRGVVHVTQTASDQGRDSSPRLCSRQMGWSSRWCGHASCPLPLQLCRPPGASTPSSFISCHLTVVLRGAVTLMFSAIHSFTPVSNGEVGMCTSARLGLGVCVQNPGSAFSLWTDTSYVPTTTECQSVRMSTHSGRRLAGVVREQQAAFFL